MNYNKLVGENTKQLIAWCRRFDITSYSQLKVSLNQTWYRHQCVSQLPFQTFYFQWPTLCLITYGHMSYIAMHFQKSIPMKNYNLQYANSWANVDK
jgi:hypothetical protein